jgi:zinc protease
MSSTRAFSCALASLIVALAATARAQHALTIPDPERYELENGLEVVLDPIPGRRDVAVVVAYHVGMADQPPGWTGLAHLVEHLMFEGSRHVGADTYIPTLERIGAFDHNAVTVLDTTEYFQTVSAEQLDTVLFLESDRMAFLLSTLGRRSLVAQQRVVARERIQRRELSPSALLPRMISTALYPAGHPYRDVHERPEDLAAIGLPQVQWFVQSYYQPANATLVVCGGFDPAAVRPRIERWFGSIRRSGALPARPDPPPIRLEGERRMILEADVQSDELRVIWPTPAYFAPGDAELDVVAHIVQTVLEIALVERGLALGVWARQASHRLVSDFTVGVVVPRGGGTQVAFEAVDATLDLLARGADAGLVRQARDLWFDRLVDRVERTGARAGLLSTRMRDGTPYTIAADARRYAAVTPERVTRAVRRLLPRDRRLVVSIGARAGAPEGGRVVYDRVVRRPR